ncbi:uncharacterized protein LOC107489344 isoform X2 [Arachis duranensis]|uniref:Uncharacterized protein LOC107489344 isoform X2 n=1 Tax=Arachis duranensis TaxID=130453 RepID=A0A9C6TNN8_ARADU|nr:uncharacterized protein LOC107489344 isoform X2 [Arachis duranensis]
MDKDWMQIKNRALLQYRRGVNEFLDFAFSHTNDDKIYCPCFKCNNCLRKSREQVEFDLLSHGIVRNYTIWYHHGESLQDESPHSSSFDSHDDYMDKDDMENMLRDHFGVWDIEEDIEEPNEEHIKEDIGEPYEEHVEEPNEDAAKFYKLLDDSEKELYPGCTYFSKLSFLMRLFHIKCLGGWSNKSFSMLLELLNDSFPKGVQLPASYYEARKIIRDLGLDYEKIDACINDCMLFWKDHDKKETCDHCGASRWKFEEKDGKRKKIPIKVLRYFRITPRLKRLYMSTKTAFDMRWHDAKRIDDGYLRHPADSEAWKSFDELHKSFSDEPRNVRLGLASDGFNPFGNMSTKYSVWPVVLIPYNLPPWKCMKDPYLMLSLLIPGSKSPGKAIDTYLRPLIEELKELWNVGVDTFDAYEKKNFKMRAAILWTVNDFPAYGDLSGWNTRGALRCPTCNVETQSKFLTNGKKFCFLGHRRFLPIRHRWRREKELFDGTKELRRLPKQLSGDDILQQVFNLEGLVVSNHKDIKKRKRSAAGKEMGSSNPWLKKSIFFELPYWRTLLLRHNLDVMHIEKNICDNVLGTLMDIPGKTKDNLNSRLDMEELGIKKDLHPIREGEKVLSVPDAIYKLNNKERRSLCEFLQNVKVPDGYSSNLRRCINLKEKKIYGLKTHDCHVLLECFLPLVLRGLFSSHDVRSALIGLCSFFKELCSKVLTVKNLEKIEEQIIITLCKLEMIFPPSFFDVMIHLPIHLASEAKIAGPVHYRWMYPIERYLRGLKAYVRNRAHPEGSIAEGYLANECLLFCSRYFNGIETKYNRVGRNWDGAITHGYKVETKDKVLPIFKQNGRPSRNCKVTRRLSLEEIKQAHLYILKNCDQVTPFIYQRSQRLLIVLLLEERKGFRVLYLKEI